MGASLKKVLLALRDPSKGQPQMVVERHEFVLTSRLVIPTRMKMWRTTVRLTANSAVAEIGRIQVSSDSTPWWDSLVLIVYVDECWWGQRDRPWHRGFLSDE